MAQTILITLTLAGADTGPFSLFSNIDGFALAFETNVSKINLVAGYVSFLVPDGASTIRVKSSNPLCSNYINLVIATTTTTTSSTIPPTTTTTTTNLYNVSVYANLSEVLGGGGAGIEYSFNGTTWTGLGAGFNEINCVLRGTISNISSGSMLYLRLVVGVNSPVQAGFLQGSNACPGPGTSCSMNFIVNSTQNCAITGKVVAGSPIGC